MSEKSERTVVKSTELDQNFKFEVAETFAGRTVLDCFQCGMCSSNCPYSDLLDIKIHQVTKMVLLGMREKVLSCRTIWVCATCYMCEERCPQGVELANVMFALMNISAREKGIPEGLKQLGELLLETGRATHLSPHRLKIRSSLGLPEMPNTDAAGLREILHKLKFDQLIEGAEKD